MKIAGKLTARRTVTQTSNTRTSVTLRDESGPGAAVLPHQCSETTEPRVAAGRRKGPATPHYCYCPASPQKDFFDIVPAATVYTDLINIQPHEGCPACEPL